MRDLEATLQRFSEFILRAKLVKEKAAPFCVRWVRRFLIRPASDEPLADQVRRFCEDLEREPSCQDWQVRQAEQALRIYFVHFLQRTDWHKRPTSRVVDENGRTDPLAALEQLRTRIRTRHYSGTVRNAVIAIGSGGSSTMRPNGKKLHIQESIQNRSAIS